jgi:hypothetical protein
MILAMLARPERSTLAMAGSLAINAVDFALLRRLTSMRCTRSRAIYSATLLMRTTPCRKLSSRAPTL